MDKNSKDKLLIEQIYGGEEDYKLHFQYVLKAFKDSRYIKVDNKPLFFIYDAIAVPIEFIKFVAGTSERKWFRWHLFYWKN